MLTSRGPGLIVMSTNSSPTADLYQLATSLGININILAEGPMPFIQVDGPFNEAYQVLQSAGYVGYLTTEVQLEPGHLNWGQQLQTAGMNLVWVNGTWHAYSTAALLNYNPSQTHAVMASRVL